MRIIHCADIHLDSAMSTNLSREQAIQRRHELLITFIKMNEYAADNNVDMILIAGDLFDTEYITENTRQEVLACINHNHRIQYVYIEGNHDEDTFIKGMINRPENFHYLEKGQDYNLNNVTVMAGGDLGSDISRTFSPDRINIVMAHGEPDIRSYAGKNIDYLALGHLHSFQTYIIDERGAACYSGCLEGRGFDEKGDKGFVLIDTGAAFTQTRGWNSRDGHKIKYRFIPFARRNVRECIVNIEGCRQMGQIFSAVESVLQQESVREVDLVKVILTGRVSSELRIHKSYIKEKYAEKYFAFLLDTSQLQLSINVLDYENDSSLKGAFIRKVMETDLSEDEKRQIMELGVTVLSGEEPD